MENEGFVLSRRINGESSTIEDQLFELVHFDVASDYPKTHFFSNKEGVKFISKELKEYLYPVFNVSTQEELLEKVKDGWSLFVKEGNREPSLDKEAKTVTIWLDDYEEYYGVIRKRRNAARAAKALFDDGQKIPSGQVVDIIERVSERAEELAFNKKEKQTLARSIPKILSENNIRLSKQDVFDIEKISVREVVETGRMILRGDRRVLKKFGTQEVHKEETWQRYFEMYGKYLLFGSVELDPKVCLDKEKTKELNDKYPDIITCNRYGFLDIIELKRSDSYIFQFDHSHNKLVPTGQLSSALSQLNGYLQIIPYAYNVDDARLKGLECASGMLIIGDRNHLFKKSKALMEYASKNDLSDEELKITARQELRKLNYSYSHMQVVLYDDLIDTLERFIGDL